MSRNRILIVDDEPAIREMVAVALELADFDVLEAENRIRTAQNSAYDEGFVQETRKSVPLPIS